MGKKDLCNIQSQISKKNNEQKIETRGKTAMYTLSPK